MKKLHVAVLIALAAIAGMPAVVSAASSDDVSVAAYPPPPPKNVQLSAHVECHENVAHIVYLAKAIGFDPVGPRTLSLTFGSTVVSPSITELSGSLVYPEAALALGVKLAFLVDGVSASASVGPVTESCGDSSPPPRSIDVSAFAPICVNDVPYVKYVIKPLGFSPTNGATITFFDKNGKQVSSVKVTELSGQLLYPGATVDANGNGTDWPGWKQTNTGEWVIDDSDAILRKGLTIKVQVDAPASDQASSDIEPAGFRAVVAQAGSISLNAEGSVSYPDATPQCSGPELAAPTPPVAELPRTGSSINATLQIAAGVLVAGLLVLITARRRRLTPPAA